jgi:acid stress chaperone HdeB
MKTSTAVVLGLALPFALSSPGRAQVSLDVDKVTCWQFVTYKVTSPQNIAIWVSGYFHGRRGETTIDTQDLLVNTAKMQEYCTKNPDVPLMQAVEKIIGSQN